MERLKQRHGHPDFYKMLEEMGLLHSEKNADYTAQDVTDPLGNFHRVSAILKIWGYDIPPSLVAIIYALKQQDAHMWMKSHNYEAQVEGSHQRLRDEAIYDIIIDILEKEEKNGTNRH